MWSGPSTAADKLPIVQYWHSEDVPEEIERLTATFRERNPGRPHHLFCEREAEEFIAAHFSPREVAAFRACAVPAMQADYFRYCAIHVMGGIYADVDFHCLRPLDDLLETAERGWLFKTVPPGNLINGFFLFSAPGHPLPRMAVEVATANIERRQPNSVNMTTGPVVFIGLHALSRLGSIEAGRRTAAELEMKEFGEIILTAIGHDYGRLAAAFEGVRVTPLDAVADYIGPPPEPPSYKASDAHWINWHDSGATIYR